MSAETGVIHDIGYQHYQGARLGRGAVARALYVHSLRTAFGIGRRARSKILPLGLLAVSGLVALILVIIGTQVGVAVLSPVGIVASFTFGVLLFVATVAPELVSGDLRNHSLPLYFSRPLSRRDYALTKFAALASSVFLFYGVALLITVLGSAFSSDSLSGVFTALGEFGIGLLAAVLHSLVLAAIALPLAALTGRRVFATGMIIGLFLITAPLSVMIGALQPGSVRELSGVIDPTRLLGGVDSWIVGEELPGFPPIGPYGPVYLVVAVLVLVFGVAAALRRYRKVNP